MATCTQCGAELKPGTKFCENCGAKVSVPVSYTHLTLPTIAEV